MTTDIAQNIADDGADEAETAETTETVTAIGAIDIESMVAPPSLIMHGGRDQLVPFKQSCRLYATLKALGKDVTFYKLDDACHACYGFRSARALRLVFDWLSDRL